MKEIRKLERLSERYTRELGLVPNHSNKINDLPDVDVEIIDDMEDLPIHQLVKIEPTKQGRYITKCQQCNSETSRNYNAAEVCNRCSRKPVLCNQRRKPECFDLWHKIDGYEIVPNLRGGQGFLPQVLVGRELGHICRDVCGCQPVFRCICKPCICKKPNYWPRIRKRTIFKPPCFNVLRKQLKIESVALDHQRNRSLSSSDDEKF